MIAVSAGRTQIARYLIDQGADVNAVNDTLSTVLHYAASKNHLEIGSYLIDKGVHVDAVNRFKQTAL